MLLAKLKLFNRCLCMLMIPQSLSFPTRLHLPSQWLLLIQLSLINRCSCMKMSLMLLPFPMCQHRPKLWLLLVAKLQLLIRCPCQLQMLQFVDAELQRLGASTAVLQTARAAYAAALRAADEKECVFLCRTGLSFSPLESFFPFPAQEQPSRTPERFQTRRNKEGERRGKAGQRWCFDFISQSL